MLLKLRLRLLLLRLVLHPQAALAAMFHGIALAAIMLYSICNIHPFAYGNGRMARICCNWMLRKVLGLPFTNTVAATPQQRREYIAALQHGHSRTQQLRELSVDQPPAPMFAPMIQLLIGRIAHAVQEAQRLSTERANSATVQDKDRIARRVRERTAAGQCIICLEDRLNIATVCCGQAIHLNCLAEWLSSGTTCVNCRAELPRVNQSTCSSSSSNGGRSHRGGRRFEYGGYAPGYHSR